MVERGAYPADRAAALSGVPKSTVHYWSREGVLVPSISAERVKLWSYSDLMGLRLIHWLRHPKAVPGGQAVPAASMPVVRRALAELAELDLDLWTEDAGPGVAVDRGGHIIVDPDGAAATLDGQSVVAEVLDLLHPFPTEEGTNGPHLRTPRPRLRIVPGKLAALRTSSARGLKLRHWLHFRVVGWRCRTSRGSTPPSMWRASKTRLTLNAS